MPRVSNRSADYSRSRFGVNSIVWPGVRSRDTADVARRSNRNEEIYRAGAQGLLNPTTQRADRTPAVLEIELAQSTGSRATKPRGATRPHRAYGAPTATR